MAVQASMGISRILFMLGTGCTGTILVQKGQLSQILGSLQSYVKRLEGGSDDTDLVSQLSQITAAVRQIQLQRPGVTMITGSNGNSTTLALPIASAGALIYGYMWWKGISFSDLSYVTKENMAAAVSNLQERLDQLTSGLNATKKKLMNQLTGMEAKMDDQNNETQYLKKEIIEMREDFIPMGDKLNHIEAVVCNMGNRLAVMDSKMDNQSANIVFLCNTVQQLETAKPLQAIEYKPQRKFTLNSTTNGLLTIMDSPKEIEQGSKAKPSISSAFSRKNTYMGISLVI